MEPVEYRPIGVIRSPFKEAGGMPIQPSGAEGVLGTVEVEAEYEAGLKDLEGFSHIVLVYHFHRSRGYELQVTPFLDAERRGVFATRAPRRPNPIGVSVVKLLGREGRVLRIECVDVIDGTPLLDIKPHAPGSEAPGPVRTGWLERAEGDFRGKRSDDRFG